MTTQLPIKNKKVVESFEQSEEGIETTNRETVSSICPDNSGLLRHLSNWKVVECSEQGFDRLLCNHSASAKNISKQPINVNALALRASPRCPLDYPEFISGSFVLKR
jgi:hypothetical protein